MFELADGRLGWFLSASLLLLISPGPVVVYIIARSLAQGRVAGVASAVGAATGSCCHLALVTAGLASLLATSEAAFWAVKLLGAAYLFYLGLRTLSAREADGETATAPPRRLRLVYLDGLMVNLLNPKTALFFLAFLPQFVNPAAGHVAAQTILLGAILISMGLVTDSLYAVAAGSLAPLLHGSPRLRRAQQWLSGLTYLALGAGAALAGMP